MNDRFCLSAFPCLSLTLSPPFLRFRYHLLEPQESWFPAVDMWMKNDVNINRVKSWLFDLTWIGFGSEGRSQKAPFLNSALLLLVYFGFILHMMHIYIYMIQHILEHTQQCHCTTYFGPLIAFKRPRKPLSKSEVAQIDHCRSMEDPKGGIKTRSQAVEASNKRLLLIFPFRLSISKCMFHVHDSRKGRLYYGIMAHGYLYKQTSFIHHNKIMMILWNLWWYPEFHMQLPDPKTEPFLPGWEPRVWGEDKEVGGQFP